MLGAKSARASIVVTSTAMCAALYAIGSYLTAYIPSPWGAGQFRPAVVIPAFFAIVFGSTPAGVGAALGTLIADSVKHGYIYPGSFLAAVPGNFIGFYLFGYIVRTFNWRSFIIASNLTLTLANFIVAALYVGVFKILYVGDPKYVSFSSPALLTFILGLTVWWFVTMLPFVLLVTPILVKATSQAVPSLVPDDVRQHSLSNELPQTLFSYSLLAPGIIMLGMWLITGYTPFNTQLTTFFGETTSNLVQWMFLLSGAFLSATGAFLRIRRSVNRDQTSRIEGNTP